MQFISGLICLVLLMSVSGRKLQCEYNSREYQVVLDPEILSGSKSFSDGVGMVIDALTTIERNGTLDFSVSRSSLQFSEVTTFRYFARNRADLQFPIKMKSRQKKINQPADFVLKFSHPDPTLACVPLTVTKKYNDVTESKFELDFHAYNGKITAKSAMSYAVADPNILGLNQNSSVDVSSIFSNLAKEITVSGNNIIADPFGSGVQVTAEFTMKIHGEKLKGTVLLLDIGDRRKAEFSFRIKGDDVNADVLSTAQEFVAQVSMIPSIILLSENTGVCDD